MADIGNAINKFKTAVNGEDVRDGFVETMTRVNVENVEIINALRNVNLEAVQGAATTATNAAATATTKAAEASASATTATTKAGQAATSATTAAGHVSTVAASATAAANSAATATTKANEAAASAATASNNATTATTKANESAASAASAATSATTAATAATTATTKASEISTAAATATTKANQAAASAAEAAGYVGTVTTKSNQAITAAGEAASSAATATTKAEEVASSIAAATTKVNEATAAATTATEKAGLISAAVAGAEASATAAASSATAATTKANEAATSAETAGNQAAISTAKAEAAAASESATATYVSTVTEKSIAAEEAANTATTKANESAESATSAATSATMAATKAQESLESKTAAEAAATTATTKAADVVGYASTAEIKAAEAETSATAAANSAAAAAAVTGISAEEKATWNGKQDALGFTPEDTVKKGVANGYAGLDDTGKVPLAQLPAIPEGHAHANKAILDKITAGTAASYDLDDFLVAGDIFGLGVGDMAKSIYDTTNNGIVDNAEKVNGHTVESDVPAGAMFTDTVYNHPSTHEPSIIVQDENNRFVSDAEKSTWNGKAPTSVATISANGLMSSSDKTKLDGIVGTGVMTAAEILTEIKTVDGSGSGLDADKLDGKDATEFAPASHGVHVTFGTGVTTLTSGGAGTTGVAESLSRSDHTHTLPVYPDLAGHAGNAGIHVTLEKQTEWNQNTTDIAALYGQTGTLGANDAAARREIIDMKIKLDEMNVAEFLNKTGIGFFDIFEDTSYIDTANTTATVASGDATLAGSKVLQMKQQTYEGFTEVELAIYDMERTLFAVDVAVNNSSTINMNITPGSRAVGEKFWYNGEIYTITGVTES